MSELIKTDDFSMKYLKFGSGENIFVAIPGIGLGSTFLFEDGIKNSYKSVAEKFTVYFFDRRENTPKGTTIDNMASDIIKACDILNISHAVFFGVSQGGIIAQTIAITHPELVDRLILSSTTSVENKCFKNVISSWVEYAQKKDITGLVNKFVDDVYSERYAAKCRDAFVGMFSGISDADLNQFINVSNACHTFETYSKLDKIKCPVFVIGSRFDHVVTCDASLEIRDKLNCDCFIYEDGSHAAYDEKKDYRTKIVEWLEK